MFYESQNSNIYNGVHLCMQVINITKLYLNELPKIIFLRTKIFNDYIQDVFDLNNLTV